MEKEAKNAREVLKKYEVAEGVQRRLILTDIAIIIALLFAFTDMENFPSALVGSWGFVAAVIVGVTLTRMAKKRAFQNFSREHSTLVKYVKT